MDCEKFDRIVLDLLYDELDELTSAAAKRHLDHCSRCRSIASGLRATREVGALPLVEPPEDLTARILEAERQVHARLPLRKRFGRGVSILAGYAMRPQLGMAALLLLMIGASLLFLRATPGEREHVRVTERGVPESEAESVTIVPVPEEPHDTPGRAAEAHGAQLAAPTAAPEFAPAPEPKEEPAKRELAKADEAAAGEKNTDADGGTLGDELYDRAMANYRAGNYGEAQRDFDVVAERGGGNAASAALFAAQALRGEAGCSKAASRFETVGAKFSGTGVGHEATWQAADCYRSLGRADDARRNYKQLLDSAGYGDRAQLALAALDAERVASRKAAAAKPTGKAKPAAKAAAPNAAPAPPATDNSF